MCIRDRPQVDVECDGRVRKPQPLLQQNRGGRHAVVRRLGDENQQVNLRTVDSVVGDQPFGRRETEVRRAGGVIGEPPLVDPHLIDYFAHLVLGKIAGVFVVVDHRARHGGGKGRDPDPLEAEQRHGQPRFDSTVRIRSPSVCRVRNSAFSICTSYSSSNMAMTER